MNAIEFMITLLLAMVLLCLATFFAWRQQQTLRRLRSDSDLSRDDRRYFYKQVYRRSFGSFLMVVLAGFLIGWLFLEPDYRTVEIAGEAAKAAGVDGQLDADTKDRLRFFLMYWIFALLVFAVLMTIVVFDVVANARFGQRHGQLLLAERKAALEAEAARFRARKEA